MFDGPSFDALWACSPSKITLDVPVHMMPNPLPQPDFVVGNCVSVVESDFYTKLKKLDLQERNKKNSSWIIWHRYAKQTIGWFWPSSSRCKDLRGQPKKICWNSHVWAAALSAPMMILCCSFASASFTSGNPWCLSVDRAFSKIYTICGALLIATPFSRLPQKWVTKKDTKSMYICICIYVK